MATNYAYIANRRKGIPAARSLELARAKPVSCGYSSFFPCGGITRQPDRPNYAWIENTKAAGLRFAGFADELAPRSVRHTGWYTDDEGDRETFRGAVYRLPRSRGFIAGYADPNNDGAAFVELRLIDADDEIGAAHAADSIAEHEAERERDYQRAWQAGRRFEDLGDEIATARRSLLDLIREAKDACDANRGAYTAIEAAIRNRIEALREKITDARKERAELEDQFGREDAFRHA